MNIADALQGVNKERGLTGSADEAYDVVLAIVDLRLQLSHCLLAACCVGVIVHHYVAIPLDTVITCSQTVSLTFPCQIMCTTTVMSFVVITYSQTIPSTFPLPNNLYCSSMSFKECLKDKLGKPLKPVIKINLLASWLYITVCNFFKASLKAKLNI